MGPRQQPGLACDECRTRKLRCDRAAQCNTCQNLGVSCTRNNAYKPRGPKRGSIRALQSRLAVLESCLGENAGSRSIEPQRDTSQSIGPETTQYDEGAPRSIELPAIRHGPQETTQYFERDTIQQDQDTSQYVESQTISHDQDTPQYIEQQTISHDQDSLPTNIDLLPEHGTAALHSGDHLSLSPYFGDLLHSTSPLAASATGETLSSEPSVPSSPEVHISDVMRADLNKDHLYFDRVHLFLPLLSRTRYFARAAQSNGPTEPFTYLQHAMWMLAASMGSQLQHMQAALYAYTRSRLDCWDLDILSDSIPIEQVQAWILLAVYELMQVNCQRGWISAGRCFRLVYLMKLHDIDNPKASRVYLTRAEVEERRRTFWNAYCLDRYGNLINQLPLMFNEQGILTRLPAPETAFQCQQEVQTEFLSQVLAGNRGQRLSSFAESIILVTISGRCLSHQLQRNVERAYNTTSMAFLTRHQWLDGILSHQIQNLSSRSLVEDELCDPMILFADMVAQTTTLLLSCTLHSVQCQGDGTREVMSGYKERALLAAQMMSNLAQKLAQLGYFKVHPSTPILL